MIKCFGYVVAGIGIAVAVAILGLGGGSIYLPCLAAEQTTIYFGLPVRDGDLFVALFIAIIVGGICGGAYCSEKNRG